jgi:hypothetical protein
MESLLVLEYRWINLADLRPYFHHGLKLAESIFRTGGEDGDRVSSRKRRLAISAVRDRAVADLHSSHTQLKQPGSCQVIIIVSSGKVEICCGHFSDAFSFCC